MVSCIVLSSEVGGLGRTDVSENYDALLIKIEGEEKTPGFEIFAAMCSVGVAAVMFILRRKRV